MKDFFTALLKTAAGAVLLAAAAACVNLWGSLAYALSVPLLAAAAALSMMYGITLAKKARLARYNEKGPLFLFKSRALPYTAAVFITVPAALAVPVRLYSFSSTELACLLPLPFVFLFSKYAAGKFARYIYSGDYAPYKSVWLAKASAALFMALIFPVTVYLAGGYDGKAVFEGFAFTQNPVAYVIARIFYTGDQITRALLVPSEGAALPAYALLLAPVFLLGSGVLFYFLINFFGFFFMKKREILSIFRPLDGSPVKPLNRFLYPFFATLLFIFIYPALFAGAQAYIASKGAFVEQAEKAADASVEMINGAAYKLGTWRKISFEREKFYGKSKAELEKAVDDAYDEMVANADKYLDWYYSLPAEYGRILKLITGSLESYMEENLKRTLTPESGGLEETFGAFEKGAAELSRAIDKILNENKAEYKEGTYSVALDVNLQDIYKSRETAGVLDLKKRLAVSAGGGLAAGAIAGAVAGKIAAKTGFKTAAKAVAKAAAQKAASAAAGIAIGAVTSLVTSPIGGIAIGAAAGIAIDKGMLTLEEMINRDDYKAEITEAVNESRKETKALLDSAFGEE